MLQNYLKVAFRNLLRHKGHALINVSGLVIGLTASILILLYVRDELGYDTFHNKAQRIFRVTSEEYKDGNFRHFAYNYAPLMPRLLNDFPEIESGVRLFKKSVVVRSGSEKRFQEEDFVFADSTFFALFDFPFEVGDARTALVAPYDIVVTASTARKYFGEENPVGQVLTIENKYDFRVTAVLQDLPSNSHFRFDFLAAMGSVRDIEGWALRGWYYPPMYSYVLLPPGLPAAQLEAKLPDFVAKNIGEYARGERILHLQPLLDIRLRSSLEGEFAPTSNAAYVYIFMTAAFFILLIACINFMNLATARSATRAREVGLRKVVGAPRRQLIRQFYSESLSYAFLSLILTIFAVQVLLPHFNAMLDKQVAVDYVQDWRIALVFVALTFVVGLVSGTYPALFLSSFQPAAVLRGMFAGTSGRQFHRRFRAVLVVLQFSVSICLIINASIIREQLGYIRSKDLGFSKEQVVIIPVRDDNVQRNWNTIKHSILAGPGVLSATATSTIPGIERDTDFPIRAEGLPQENEWNMLTMLADHDFLKTFDMEIVAGRDFDRTFTTDTSAAFVLNETAVAKIGWRSAVGKKFEMLHLGHGKSKSGHVIGVVKDFHFKSLHHRIDPLVIQISPRSYYLDNLAVKVAGGNLPQTLAFLEQKWRELVPHRPFEYQFLDSVFEQAYLKEQRLAQVFDYFAGLAIFVGCLGLLGLASYVAEQRAREISIRKVLGASGSSIIFMLSRDLVGLIAMSFAVAAPVAYYAMNNWLQAFDYRIDLHADTFLHSGFAAFTLAFLTVAYQALRAALTNPVDALKCP